MNHISELYTWFLTPPGRRVAITLQSAMDSILPELFGYHLIQIGLIPKTDLCRKSRILHHWLVTKEPTDNNQSNHQLLGESSQLPFEDNSIDMVLLPHVIEFEHDMAETLKEASRVLMPGGYMILSVFNPYSFMGVWQRSKKYGAAPWNGTYISAFRLNDWMSFLSLNKVKQKNLMYVPPFESEQLLSKMEWMDRVCPKIIPFCSALTLIVARKRVSNVRPIRPHFLQPTRSVYLGGVNPSARVDKFH